MNFFRQMRESVIDFRFYREIKDNKFSKSFVYFLVLYLIIYFISGTKVFVVMRAGIDEVVSHLGTDLPDFRLQNGEFQFEGKMPYYLSNNANEVYVIDTTGQTTEAALTGVQSGMLITKDKLIVKQSAAEIRQFNMKEFQGVTLTKADIMEFLPKLSWLIMIFLVFGYIFALGWKLLNVVILALLGLLAAGMLKADLKYRHLMNISAFALTLPMLIQLAVGLSGYAVPYFWAIYWLISILYVTMAVKACKEDLYQEPGPGENGTIV